MSNDILWKRLAYYQDFADRRKFGDVWIKMRWFKTAEGAQAALAAARVGLMTAQADEKAAQAAHMAAKTAEKMARRATVDAAKTTEVAARVVETIEAWVAKSEAHENE
jgi:hypothetical protein